MMIIIIIIIIIIIDAKQWTYIYEYKIAVYSVIF